VSLGPSSLAWIAAILLAIAAAALAGYQLIVPLLARRAPIPLQRLGFKQTRETRAPDFIGREKEQDQFLDLIGDRQSGPHLLLVSGAPGMGKRALLRRFEFLCEQRDPPVLCSHIVNVGVARSKDSLLAALAERLEERTPQEAFGAFRRALEKYHTVSAGRRTTSERALALTRGAVEVTKSLPVPGAGLMGVAGKALESQAAEDVALMISDRLSGRGDLQSVIDAFTACLVELAGRSGSGRLVLFFDDLDKRPEEHDVQWLFGDFLPELSRRADRTVLIVAAVEDSQRFPDWPSALERGEPLRLQPFHEDEAEQFVRSVIGITNPRLVKEIVDRSAGKPQRLANYRAYFRHQPAETREADHLPAEADAWAVDGEVYDLLQSVRSDHIRRLIVVTSPLRWLNATLLERLSERLGLKPEGDESTLTSADLLQGRARPALLKRLENGWGLDDELRISVVRDFRRLDPSRYQEVHRVACRYHLERLLQREGYAQEGAEERETVDLFEFEPRRSPEDRLHDPDYVASLAEWLYHLLALKPAEAFPALADHAAEAIYYDRHAVAHRLLSVGSELELPKRQRLYLDLLARAATHLEASDYAGAIRVLEDVAAAGAPTPLIGGVIAAVLGYSYWQLEEEYRTVELFQRADEQLHQIPADDQRAQRILCMNRTWLAYGLTRRERSSGGGQEQLREALELAKKLGDPALLAELQRVRGLLMYELGDLDQAEVGYGKALRTLAGRSPDSAALVRRNLAQVLLLRGDHEGAERELGRAAAIYRYLGDRANEALVAVEKMTLDLKRGRMDRALAEREKVFQLSDDEAATHCMIGNALFEAEQIEEAEAEYREASRLEPHVAAYHSRLAAALEREGREEEAIASLEAALERAPGDPSLTLRLARLLASVRETEKSERLFEELHRARTREVNRFPDQAGPHSELGSLLFEWGRFEEAAHEYKIALQLAPDEPDYRLRLGQCLDELGRTEEAKDEFLQAAASAPGRSYLWSWVAYMAGKLEPQTSVKFLQRALECRGSDDAELRYQLGLALLRRDRRPMDAGDALGRTTQLQSASSSVSSPAALAGPAARAARAGVELKTEAEKLYIGRAKATYESSSTWPGRHQRQFLGASEVFEQVRAAPPDQQLAIQELETAVKLEPLEIKYLVKLAELYCERRGPTDAADRGELACEERWERAEELAARARDEAQKRVDEARKKLDGDNGERSKWTDRQARQALERAREDLRSAQEVWTRIQRRSSYDRVIRDFYPVVTPIAIEVSTDLEGWVGETPLGEQLISHMLPDLRESLFARIGVRFPGVRVRLNEASLTPGTVSYSLHEVPRYVYVMPADFLAGVTLSECTALTGVRGQSGGNRPWDGGPATWLSASEAQRVEKAGIPVWDPRGYIVATLGSILERHAEEFVGLEETRSLLEDGAGGRRGNVPDSALPGLAVVLRRLLHEGVPITDLETISQEYAAGTANGSGVDVIALTERIRRRLAPQFVLRGLNGADLKVGALSPAFEARFFRGAGRVERNGSKSFVRMPPEEVQAALALVRQALGAEQVGALVVSDGALRPYIRSVLELEFPSLRVLAREEVAGLALEEAFVIEPDGVR
jgi:tetratricopeptide (TPR) repeat protein